MIQCLICDAYVDDLRDHAKRVHNLTLGTTPATPKPFKQKKPYNRVDPDSKNYIFDRIESEGSAYKCKSCRSDVTTVGSKKVGNHIVRRKECGNCGERFTTHEIRMDDDSANNAAQRTTGSVTKPS